MMNESSALTPEQLEDIEISRQQFAAGLGIPHEEVMKKFDAMYPDEKKIVEERHQEMESGVGIPHDEVCKKTKQWFRQKNRR